jgi:aspartyl-tRNA(Asn)/glutamyl-tRNA(Gln) amidotransferase subunit A
MEITDLSAVELANKIKNREISAVEVTRKYLDNIGAREDSICAFMGVFDKDALRQAGDVDKKIKKGIAVGELAGVPVAIKDNMCIKNTKVTCSSKILENYVSPYDATVITKLKKADAVFIGKTNMDEFAMGSSTENSAFKVTKNPRDSNCIPGGSSGGSAASVGSNMVPVALGSDTGGSIRQPAACCGVVGMKPTYGRVSRYGLVAFASSLDQIGPFAKNTEDCALLLKVISGYDNLDSTSVDLPVPDYTRSIKNDIKGLRIGLPKEYFTKGLDPEVELAVRNAVKVLKDEGAVVKEISLPHTEYAVAVYYIIAPAEASSNLARYDGVRYGYRDSRSAGSLIETYKLTRGEGFGPEVKRRIMLGTYTLSAGYYEAYYGKAQKVRTLIKRDFDRAFKEVDVVITPTSPTVAFKISEKTDDPLQMYLSDVFTIPCNLAGIPGISLPCGVSKGGLPVGLQVMGRSFDEETILRVAYNYEKLEGDCGKIGN